MNQIRKSLETFVRIFALCGLSAILLTLITGYAADSEVTQGPGDNRTGYESADYESRSISLLQRTGKAADLLHVLQSPPWGCRRYPFPGTTR